MTSRMSYGLLGSSGMMLVQRLSVRSGSSCVARTGRILHVVLRQKGEQFADQVQAVGLVLGHHSGPRPERELCTLAPPRSSKVTSSWVTALTTSGPVTNM